MKSLVEAGIHLLRDGGSGEGWDVNQYRGDLFNVKLSRCIDCVTNPTLVLPI